MKKQASIHNHVSRTIGERYTRRELRDLERMKEEFAYLGLDESGLCTLLNEARHWRGGSKLRLAQVVRNRLGGELGLK